MTEAQAGFYVQPAFIGTPVMLSFVHTRQQVPIDFPLFFYIEDADNSAHSSLFLF
jgi:hypothetical protein